MTDNVKARTLRERLAKGEFILAPGIYDGISARVADKMGFPALYMTGYGATASMLGLPDAGLATYSDMVGRAEMICSVIDTPLIADADTGYGGLLNVQRTVRGYEAAGVAAIQIEDQEMPKKCGHTPGRRVVPAEDMVLKIRVACEARRDEATLIMARTDARTALGLDEALRRAKLYEEAGADVIFVESPESEAELERIGKRGGEAAARQHGRVRQDAARRGREAEEVGLRSRDLSRPRLQRRRRGDAPGVGPSQGQRHEHRRRGAAVSQHARADGLLRRLGLREEVGAAVNGQRPSQFSNLARLPARVWLQAASGLIGFAVLAVLGFALIAGFAAVVLVIILLYRLRAWVGRLFGGPSASGPPAHTDQRPDDHKVTDVTYEIVDRRDDKRP